MRSVLRRSTTLLGALAASLAGCGGSPHAASSHSQGHPLPLAARAAPNTAANRRAPRASATALSPYPGALPTSTRGPTTCTVYEPGYATQIIVDSESLNVRAECQVWASGHPGDGYLWGYEQGAPIPQSTRLCTLIDPHGVLKASVIEDTGFVPISSSERARGALACASIRAAGWTAPPRPAKRGKRRRSGRALT